MKPGKDRFGDLKTLLAPAAALLALAFWLKSWPAAGAAPALLLAALASPRLAGPLARGWLLLAGALGRAAGLLLLGLVYFLCLTPAALLARLCGHDPLRLGRDPGAATYFRARAGRYAPADLEKPW